MPARRTANNPTRQSYFVVMLDFGPRGREAVVNPEVTRREVISRLVSGEYDQVHFIHEVDTETRSVTDVTCELQLEASVFSMSEAA